jgi:hypothetical protein
MAYSSPSLQTELMSSSSSVPCPAPATQPAVLAPKRKQNKRRAPVDELAQLYSVAKRVPSPDNYQLRMTTRRFSHPGPHPMSLCDSILLSEAGRHALLDWVVECQADAQQAAATARLLARPAHLPSREERRSDTQLFDLFVHAKVQAMGHSLLVSACHDLWGLGFNPATGMPNPPSNHVVLVTLMRLLFGADPARDAPAAVEKRQTPDPVHGWAYPAAAGKIRTPVTGDLLSPGQRCALWTGHLDRASVYRPASVVGVDF